VACRTDPTKNGHNGISLFLVEADRAGIDRKKIKTMGWWAGNTSYITFENVRVPKANLIGRLNEGFRYIMENFNHERFHMAAGVTSACQRLIESSIKFARVRQTFGKRLIDHQVIRHKIADMAMRTEAQYALCEQVAYLLQSKAPSLDVAPRIALLKVLCTQGMEFCAREAAQILGGNSYARQGHGEVVEKIYRDVRVNAIGGGSEEIMKDLAIRMSKL
jgi:acyl-CoA dehydrogenase